MDKTLIARIRSGLASEQEMREAGRENVRAIKADGGAMHFRFATKKPPATLNAESRTVEHLASDESVDRMGDRISVRGWDLSNFQKNPVLLWDHNSSLPPIGRVQRARKGKDEAGVASLTTESRFHDAEKNPHAELIYRMVADGDLPAVSVGFNPIEIERPKSDEEAKALGVGEYGVYFKRQELLELSVVTIPAHAGALAKKLDTLATAGEFSWAVIDEVMKMLTPDRDPGQRVFAVKHACEIIDDLGTPPVSKGSTSELCELKALVEEIRDARGADIGVEASARLIRSIVRDEITAALRAAAKTPSLAAGDDDIKAIEATIEKTESADFFARVLTGLSGK